MKTARYKKGFTIVEVILVAVIVLVMVGFAFTSLRGSKEREQVRAAAEQLAEDLRWARQRAMTTQQPCGIVIPSSDSFTKVYIIREGQGANPKTLKIVDFKNSYPSANIFVGFWDLDPNKTSGQNTASPPVIKGNPDKTAMSPWGGSSADYAYLFTPSGTVKTNGLPNFDGTFHIVVTRALAAAPGGVPTADDNSGFIQASLMSYANAASLYQLTGVWKPAYTVEITANGEISVKEGVTGAPESIYKQTPPPAMGDGAPVPPGITAPPSNLPPTINKIDIKPDPSKAGAMPPGVDVTVTKGSHVNFTVDASDPDNDKLFYTWSAKKGGTDVSSTTLSSIHTQSVDWFLNDSAAVGDQFTITVKVDDGKGGSDTRSKIVQVITGGKIAFTSKRDGNYEIYVMNEDGTNQTRLTNNPAEDWMPAFSPDGTKIVFYSKRDGNSQIYLMNADGTNQRRITNNSANDECPVFSPDGSKIAFDSDRDGNLEIYIMNADGTNQTRLTNNPRNDYLPSFSADGKKIAFTAVLAYGINDLYVMNSDGTGVVDITNTWVYNGYPRFSPVGSKIVFYSTRDRDVNHDEIYTMNSDGTGVTRLTDTSGSGATNADASFSSDGSKIIFISTRDGVLYEIYTMNADGTNQKRLTNDLTEKRYPSWWHTGK